MNVILSKLELKKGILNKYFVNFLLTFLKTVAKYFSYKKFNIKLNRFNHFIEDCSTIQDLKYN